MTEINLNTQLASLLQAHGIEIYLVEDFIHTDLPDEIKFKAGAVYQEVNGHISSTFTVVVLTDKGEAIIESFGDVGATLEEALDRNMQNFSTGSLYPILAALGYHGSLLLEEITVENWIIHSVPWKAYIGNLIPKCTADSPEDLLPPPEFFRSVEQGIQAQPLGNRLHWFRSFYCQLDDKIIASEFLMDNQPVAESDRIFRSVPVIPGIKFYSCRNFVLLLRPEL